MARIETNTNLVGKTIVLLDGTKSKIEGAIASGYKVKGRTARIATRCIVKEGSHFKEIERMDMRQLEDTGEGYVKVKATAKAGGKTSGKKTTAADKPAGKKAGAKAPKEKEPKVRRKTKPSDTVDELDINEFSPLNVINGKAKPAVEIATTDEELTETVAKRIVDAVANSQLAKVCADNKTPIANDLDITYEAEFAAESRTMQITMRLQYAEPTVVESSVELDEAVAKRAAKLAAKKVGKALAKAIREAFDLEDANDLLPGTVLSNADVEYVFVGESAKHAGKALMYLADTDSFKSFAADKLSDFEIVAEESDEDEEEVEEEEEVDEEEEIDDEDGEDEDGEDEDGEDEDDGQSGDEYEYVSVNADQLSLVSKKVTAKYHAALAERFNVSEEALVPGLSLTDGETTFAYLGCDNKGGLLVIDLSDDADEDDNVLVYSKADIKTLDGFNAVLGDAEEIDDEDAEEIDDEDAEEIDDEDAEEIDDEDDDFDFEKDLPNEDLEDLSEDELRDRVLEMGLSTVRRADKLNAKQLRKLLTDATA